MAWAIAIACLVGWLLLTAYQKDCRNRARAAREEAERNAIMNAVANAVVAEMVKEKNAHD